MLFTSSPAHLHTRQPSTTTCAYTVSNAAPRSSRAANTLQSLAGLARAVLALAALAVVVAKLSDAVDGHPYAPWVVERLSARLAPLRVVLDDGMDGWVVAGVGVLLLYVLSRRGYVGMYASTYLRVHNPRTHQRCCAHTAPPSSTSPRPPSSRN